MVSTDEVRRTRPAAAGLRWRRQVLAGLMILVLPGLSCAEDWPNRAVKIVVPYGPGGIADVFGRLAADRLARTLGQPFIVESRPGAGGSIGTGAVARAPADGYTLLFAGGAQLSVVPLMQTLTYDPVKDLAPVSMITVNGMALAVNLDLPVATTRELIDYAHANPGKLSYGSTGLGSSSHLAPAALSARERMEMVVVPFQATPPSIMALINGSIQVFFGNISDVLEWARDGKLRLLAISTERRDPRLPEVATVAETVPGFVMTGWNAVFAPAGTPPAIIERLALSLAGVCKDADVLKIMASLGVDPACGTPAQLADAIAADLPIYRAAAEAAGLRRQ